MPCNSDYLNPTDLEINLSKVLALHMELDSGKFPKDVYGNGYSYLVYGCANKNFLDKEVARLCSRLKTTDDISQYSLEMQLWWRDHQAADKLRLEEERIANQQRIDKEKVLSKLTPEDRKTLGL